MLSQHDGFHQWGFPSMGYPPIALWFYFMEDPSTKMDDEQGYPVMTQETSIFGWEFPSHVSHQRFPKRMGIIPVSIQGMAEALGQAFRLGRELLAAEVRHDAPGELRQVSGRLLQLGPVVHLRKGS